MYTVFIIRKKLYSCLENRIFLNNTIPFGANYLKKIIGKICEDTDFDDSTVYNNTIMATP